MKKPSGKSYNDLPFKIVVDMISVLLRRFGKFAEIVADALAGWLKRGGYL